MEEVRVRFAPSPTGALHIGVARTALYNWLFARHHGGRFLLRIEDTDRERSTAQSRDDILDGLRWLGLDWDEGPYYQSERGLLYRRALDRLLAGGRAYRCICAPEDLEQRRQARIARGERPAYDGRCRDLRPEDIPGGRPFVVRFRSPGSGVTRFVDMIHGAVEFDNRELDDLVLSRSDGSPTYNFVVVVDDIDMGITHVIRGDDHLGNTARQILLYDALSAPPPAFAHLPMILNRERRPYSKRDGAVGVTEFRREGYLPRALVNGLARLGWGHGDQEVFSIEELILKFEVERASKAGAVFDPEKLLWLNAHYMKAMPAGELAGLLPPFLRERGHDVGLDDRLVRIAVLLRERAKTLAALADGARFFFAPPTDIDEEARRKFLTEEARRPLADLVDRLAAIEAFDERSIERAFHLVCEERGLKLGLVAQPVRVALTGAASSPGIFEVAALLGRAETLARLGRALDHLAAAEGVRA